MTSALQNRLVGTIIVVALVVILLPEFLDGEKRTNQQEFVTIPPVLEVVEVEESKDIDLSNVEQEVNQPIEVINETALDDADLAETPLTVTNSEPESGAETASDDINQTTNNTASSDTTASTTSVLLNNRPKPKAVAEQPLTAMDTPQTVNSGWVVQLGSFRHEKNVNALIKTLNDAGYRAYSNPVMTNVGKLNKVFVGPELDKAKLERALPHLQEITKLKGKITAFEVSAK
jgi:DedD protein